MFSNTVEINFQESVFLHNIVNGDFATEALRDSRIEEDFLSWMDVLHDGPVSDGLRLEELSNIRAKFITECDWAYLENAKGSIRKYDFFSKIVTNSTKWCIGTALSCSTIFISCRC